MQFLIDENLPADLAGLIRSRGHRAVAIVETARRGLKDAEVWDWAARESAILVTLDLDFPLPERRPAPHALILLRPSDQNSSTICGLWTKFCANLSPLRIRGKVISVRHDRARSRMLP